MKVELKNLIIERLDNNTISMEAVLDYLLKDHSKRQINELLDELQY